ncbi:MAG: hypothetical protein IJR44_02270, partial [Neisseriaceae bacterium]|nr:hypothetical protein [Neisseriaceae bacterium]
DILSYLAVKTEDVFQVASDKELNKIVRYNKNFREWFGLDDIKSSNEYNKLKNKVVMNGKMPRLFYRGIAIGDNEEQEIETQGRDSSYHGDYFASNPRVAATYPDMYENPKVFSGFLRPCENPFIIPCELDVENDRDNAWWSNVLENYNIYQAVCLFDKAGFEMPYEYGEWTNGYQQGDFDDAYNGRKITHTETYYYTDAEINDDGEFEENAVRCFQFFTLNQTDDVTQHLIFVNADYQEKDFVGADKEIPYFNDALQMKRFTTNDFCSNLMAYGEHDGVFFLDLQDMSGNLVDIEEIIWTDDRKSIIANVWGFQRYREQQDFEKAYFKEVRNKGDFNPDDNRIFYSLFDIEQDRKQEIKQDLRIAKCLQGEPVCVLNERLAPHKGMASVRQWAVDVFNSWDNKIISPELGEIVVNEKSARDTLGHGLSPFKIEAIRSIKDVIEQGVVVTNTQVRNEDHYFISAPVTIENTEDIVTVLVKRDVNTQRMYLHSVLTKESILNKDFGQKSTPEHLIPTADTEVSEQSHKLYSGDVGRILQNYLKVNIPQLEKEVKAMEREAQMQEIEHRYYAKFADVAMHPEKFAELAKAHGISEERIETAFIDVFADHFYGERYGEHFSDGEAFVTSFAENFAWQDESVPKHDVIMPFEMAQSQVYSMFVDDLIDELQKAVDDYTTSMESTVLRPEIVFGNRDDVQEKLETYEYYRQQTADFFGIQADEVAKVFEYEHCNDVLEQAKNIVSGNLNNQEIATPATLSRNDENVSGSLNPLSASLADYFQSPERQAFVQEFLHMAEESKNLRQQWFIGNNDFQKRQGFERIASMSPIELTALIDCQPEFQQKLQAYMDIVQEFQAAQIQAMADYEAAANTWRQTPRFQELKNHQQTLQLLNLRDEYLDGGWKFASAQNGDMTNGERLKNAMYNAVDEVAPAVKYLFNQEEFWEERDDKAFLMRAQIRDLLEKHIGEAAQLVEVKTLHQLWKEDPVMYDAISKTTNGFFMPKADRAVLVADSFIKNPEYAVWTAYHELGHRGIHLQGRELWDEWLQEAQKNPTVKAIADSTQRIYANKGHSLDDIQATEEAMVDIFAAYKTQQWDRLEHRHQLKIHDEFKKPLGT